MNKSYKIWIMLFVIINLLLLIWSMGYLKFLEEKFIKSKDIRKIIEDIGQAGTFDPTEKN